MRRFWSKADTSGTGCWLWGGAVNASGYGRFLLGGKVELAHRVAWMLTHGSPPDTVDHECHNAAVARGECAGGVSCPHRRCVRPDHMRGVTRAQNSAASPLVVTTVNASKTACVNGHPLSGDNLALRDGGKRRRCLTCARASKNQSMARLRAGQR